MKVRYFILFILEGVLLIATALVLMAGDDGQPLGVWRIPLWGIWVVLGEPWMRLGSVQYDQGLHPLWVLVPVVLNPALHLLVYTIAARLVCDSFRRVQ